MNINIYLINYCLLDQMRYLKGLDYKNKYFVLKNR